MTKPLNRRPLLWGCTLIIGVALATATAAQKTPPDFPLTMEELEAFADPDELTLVRSYSYYENEWEDEQWFLRFQSFYLQDKPLTRTVDLVDYQVPGTVVRSFYSDRSENEHVRLSGGQLIWGRQGEVIDLYLGQVEENDLPLFLRHGALRSIFIANGVNRNADIDVEDFTQLRQLESLTLGFSQLINLQALCDLNQLQWFSAPVSYPQGPVFFNNDCTAPLVLLAFDTARLDDLNLANLSRLVTLSLQDATLHKLAVDGSSLPELEYINLREAELPDDLSQVHLPEGLVQLNLQGATNDSVNQLNLPDNLRYLDLRDSRLTDYSFITTAKNLESLVLGGSSFTQFELLSQLTNLKHLSLYDLNVTDDDLTHLARLARLEYLDMPRAPITTLEPLADLNNLRFLLVHETNVTSYGQIPYFPSLISLSLPNQDDEYESTDQLPEHIQKMLAASWLDEYRRNYGESCLGQAPCTIAPWMIKDDTY